jgi:tetratricopeptide (TPR) repeat protein
MAQSQESDSLYMVAKALYDKQEYKKSLPAFEKLLAFDKENLSKEKEVISLDKSWLGSVYYKLGDITEAKKYDPNFYELPPVDRMSVKQALSYATTASQALTLNDVLFWLKRQLDAEIEALGEDHYYLYGTYASMSAIYFQQGNEIECRKNIALAKGIADKWKTTTMAWHAVPYACEFGLEQGLGNDAAAMQAYETAWDLLAGDIMSDPVVYSLCLNKFLQINLAAGNYDIINAELTRDISVINDNLTEDNAAGFVSLVRSINACVNGIGRADLALGLIARLTDLLDKESDEYMYITYDRGILNISLNKFREAEDYLTEVLEMQKQRHPGEQEQWVELLRYLGVCYTGLSEYDKAEKCFKDAAKIYKRSGKQYISYWLQTVNQLASLSFKTSHFEQAVDYIEDCIKQVNSFNSSPTDLAYLTKELGDCYAQIDKAKSLATYKKVIDIMAENELAKDNDIYVQSRLAIIGAELQDIEAIESAVNNLLDEIKPKEEYVGHINRVIYIKKFFKGKLFYAYELDRALEIIDDMFELSQSVPGYDKTELYEYKCKILFDLNRYEEATIEAAEFREYAEQEYGKRSVQYLTSLDASRGVVSFASYIEHPDLMTNYGEEILKYIDAFNKEDAGYLNFSIIAALCFNRDPERQKSIIENALSNIPAQQYNVEVELIASAYNTLCAIESNCGNLEGALHDAKLLQSCLDKVSNPYSKIGYYSQIGYTFDKANMLHDAETAYLNALKIGASFGEDYQGLIELYKCLSDLYGKMGQNELAVDYLNKESRLLQINNESVNSKILEIDNKRKQLWSYYFSGLKEYCYNQILELEEELNQNESYKLLFGPSLVPYLKAQYFYYEHDYAKAADYIQESLIFQRSANALELATNIYFASDDYERAGAYAEDYLSFIDDTFGDSKQEHIKPYKMLGDIAILERDIDLAWDYYTKCFEVSRDYINENILTLTSKQREDFWNMYSPFYNQYLPSVAALSFSPYVIIEPLLYDAALFSKGFLLSADQAISSIVKKASTEIVELYKKYQSNKAMLAKMNEDADLASLFSTGKVNEATPEEYRKEQEQLKALKRESEETERLLTDKIREKYPDMLAYKTYSWRDVQRNLPKRAAAIEYLDFPTDSVTNTVAALVLKRGMACPSYEVLFTYDPQQVNIGYEIYDDTKLGDALFERVSDLLADCDEVYYSPQGILLSVAVESLPRSESLVKKDLKLYRLSSTSVLAEKRSKRKGYNATLFGGLNYGTSVDSLMADADKYPELKTRSFVADNAFRHNRLGDADIKPLPGTLKEVETIADLLTNKRVDPQLKVGDEGTETAFKALSGRYGSILHISTHGFFNASNIYGNLNESSYEDLAMEQSGLLLAGAVHRYIDEETLPDDLDDGILKSSEIAKLDLNNVDLAVLSACETGLGAVTREGVFGLQRGLKKAGVNSILMSLWKVDDDATCALMTQFYANWLSGKSKYESLELAKQYIRSQERWSSPKYWAAFILLDAIN